jgi:hypothetical protein
MMAFVRRVVIFGLLAACVGGYLRYRGLEQRARLLPQASQALGSVRTIAGQFSYLNRQGIQQHEQRWNIACVKRQWMVAGRGTAGEDYRRDMRTFVQFVDQIQAKHPWDVLGEPAVEASRRLTKLRDWFDGQVENVEGWECNDEEILDTLARLSDVSTAWEACLGELTKLRPEQVLSDGSPAFADCVESLPDTVAAEAGADETQLAERVVPLGGEQGDQPVRVMVGGRQWRQYVASPDGRRIAYVVRRGGQHLVVVDGEEGPLFEYIATGTEGGDAGGPIFSDDSEHVVYSGKRYDGWHVVIDGEEGPAWQAVQGLTVSPEDGRVAFAALRDGRWRVVVDGQEQPHPPLRNPEIVFSPNGRRVTYHSGEEEDFFLVTDGVRGQAFRAVYSAGPYFSPDSRRVAHIAMRDAEHLVVAVDAQEMPGFGAVIPPVIFSPDSRRVAYVANMAGTGDRTGGGGGQVMVVDGTAGPVFDRITGFTFSDDSQRYLYVGQRAKRGVVVVDGRESPPYDALSSPGPRFSPDSAHVGWAGVVNGRMHLAVDFEPGPAWENGIAGGSPVWSDDSSRTGYVAARGRQAFAVVDGREGIAWDEIKGNLVFSADGAHFAYIARRADRWYVVRDKKEGAAFEEILSPAPLFSDDSERLAYVARRGRSEVVVVDDEAHDAFRDIDPATLAFSPDSAHVAYAGWKAGWRLVVDGHATAGRVAGRNEELPLRFASSTQVSMLGLGGVAGGVVRLDITLPGRTAMRGAGASAD